MKQINKIIATAIISCCAVFSCFSVSANSIDSIQIVNHNTEVHVEGTLTGGSAEQIVTLEVLAPNKSLEDLDEADPAGALEVFSHIDVQNVKDGKFSFTFPVGTVSGEYTVRISSRALEAPIITTYQFYTNEDYVDVVNNSKDTAAFKTHISTFLEMNQYENEAILQRFNSTMSEELQTAVYSKTIGKKAETIEELITAFEDSVICVAIEKVEGYALVHDILVAHNDILQLDFSKYDNLANKSAVDREIAGQAFNSRSEIKEFFENAVDNAGNNGGGGNGGGGNGGSGGRPSGGSGNSSSSSGSGFPVFENTSDPAPVDETEFHDLDGVEWAVNAIRKLSALNVIEGDGDGNFRPMDQVSREQFIKMMIAAFFTVDQNAEADFPDVPKTHWSYPYIATAQKLGLVSGYADGSFGLGQEITRQEVAVLMYRCTQSLGMQIPEKYPAMTFADQDEIADYAEEAISKMQQGGIMQGVGEGRVAPNESTTRAEAAQMIYGVMNMEEQAA